LPLEFIGYAQCIAVDRRRHGDRRSRFAIDAISRYENGLMVIRDDWL